MERFIFSHRLRRTLALLFAALFCGCEDRSRTARDAAEELSRMLAEQRFTEAYAQAASAFKFTRSANYFEARVRDLGLCEASASAWGEPERHGRLATVHGVFTLKDGGKLPLNFTFSMEDGAWRLLEARSDPAPGAPAAKDVFAVVSRTRDTAGTRALEILEPNAPGVPDEPQLRQLAEDTLMLFNEAIQNGGDFSALYAAASDRWKFRGREPRELSKFDPENKDNRLTLTALRTAFASHLLARVDLTPIRGKKMILSEPARVNSDGVLNFGGTFDAILDQASAPRSPRKVEFSLEYVREAAHWKLFGITVQILTLEKTPAPNP